MLAGLARARAQETQERDLAQLLEGVREITAPGIPGALTVHSRQAFAVVLGEHAGERAPVVAAARQGGTRLVAFAHDGYGSEGAAGELDTGKLLLNALRWASGPKGRAIGGPRILVWGCGLSGWLNAQGMRAQAQPGALSQAKLSDFDAVLLGNPGLAPAEVEALAKYLKGGGGVVGLQTAWGWAQHAGAQTIRDNRLNQLFTPWGLGWTTATTGRTTEKGYSAGSIIPPQVHALRALDAIEAAEQAAATGAAGAVARQAEITIGLALSVLPAEDTQLRPRLQSLLNTHGPKLLATQAQPLLRQQVLLRLLARIQPEFDGLKKPLEIRAHPSADDFPGRPAEKAARVTRKLSLSAAVPGWASTGLYADAGQALTIDIPKETLGRGLRARIGCHTDNIADHEAWKRMPQISQSFALTQPSQQVASAFGGLLFIEVPEGLLPGELSVLVRNAVEAPLYVHGVTSLEEWRANQRNKPAPWAELVSSKVALSVPSEHVRALEDPAALMSFWDQVLDAMADFAGSSRERRRPERIVADRQISAGYMHSGYPIMTHLDAAQRMVSLPTLQSGEWGLYHELGHNHQRPEWTFDCLGEVTNNVFVLYVLDTLCRVPLETGHAGVAEGPAKLSRHLEAGGTWESFCNDPFLALHMYRQLIAHLGWDKLKGVIASYLSDPPEMSPKTQEARRDQWMIRCARACGNDLSRFFRSWGVPVSDEACAQISSLPEWMPADWPQ